MQPKPLDYEHWPRRPYFEHYLSAVPTTYSMTVRLDITRVRASGRKLYPVMLYCITQIMNRHSEFRTVLTPDGMPAVFDFMVPCYTIFHRDTETFANLWTPAQGSLDAFCAAYEADLAAYGSIESPMPKPDVPANTFPVSMVPWISFEGFNLNLQKGYDYLTPVFTMGRFKTVHGKTTLPFALQMHHAVCDGFHAARFVNELQQLLDTISL